MIAGASAVVVVLAGGLLGAPLFVSEEAARLAAIAALRNATGVDPRIDGPVSLTLLPRPALRLEAIRLDDGKRPAFTAAALQANVEVMPLLSGEVRVGSLVFERPLLTVEVGDDGAMLVGMPLRQRAANDPPMQLQPEIRFLDGTVLFRTSNGRLEPLTAVDAALATSGSGLTATGSVQWRATPVSVSLSIADASAFGRGDRTGFRIRLDAEPVRLAFEGGLAYRNGIQADGALAAEAKSLRAALSLMSVAPLTRGGLGPFKLKAQAALTGNSLALSGLSVELDGNRAEGGLTAKYAGGRTLVQATLASESSDLTPYSGGFAVSDDEGRDWSREPIDLTALEGFDVDARLSSGRVVVRKTELRRVAATMSLRSGAFTLSVGEAQFHGGTLRGHAAVSGQADGNPKVKVEANITDFDLAGGFAALAGVQRVDGKGTLTLALEGSGKHMHAITSGLAGKVTLAAKDGALNGINVEQALRRLERRPLSGAADVVGGRTPFDRLSAKFHVADGKARVEEAQMDSSLVRVRLAGETSIAHRDYDLRGVATLVRSGGAGKAAEPFDLPFVLLGAWDRPFLLPDPTALIQRSDAAAPLLDAMRNRSTREANDGVLPAALQALKAR
jgi:AsmA protein